MQTTEKWFYEFGESRLLLREVVGVRAENDCRARTPTVLLELLLAEKRTQKQHRLDKVLALTIHTERLFEKVGFFSLDFGASFFFSAAAETAQQPKRWTSNFDKATSFSDRRSPAS